MYETLPEHLLETWAIHNRIHLFLLESVPAEAFHAIAASKGRSVVEQFAHIHKVRLMWLKAAAPHLLNNCTQELVKGDPLEDISILALALTQSSHAIEEMLREGLKSGRIKSFKPHPTAFLGYLISHESHHRGQIALILKQAGYPVSKKISFGMWEWGVR